MPNRYFIWEIAMVIPAPVVKAFITEWDLARAGDGHAGERAGRGRQCKAGPELRDSSEGLRHVAGDKWHGMEGGTGPWTRWGDGGCSMEEVGRCRMQC